MSNIVNKFNSAEYGFVAVDQAEETERDDIMVLKASRRMKIQGRDLPLPYMGLWTANPAACWLLESGEKGASKLTLDKVSKENISVIG